MSWMSLGAASALRPLASGAAAVAAGLALGAVLARASRSWRLHWSWSALALACAILARGTLGGDALPAIVASAWAARSGRRWHREDVESGRDLRELAAARRTPLDALRSLAAHAQLLLETRLAVPVRPARRGAIMLGRDDHGRAVSTPLPAGSHALVVGATGSGKTVTQARIAVHAIDSGGAVVALDPKGDPTLLAALAAAAGRARRPFLRWSAGGDTVYNPYARGSETEIADKLLAGERFTEPHYLRQAQRHLGHVVRALRAADAEVSLAAVVEHLDPDRLELLARELPERAGNAVHRYLDALSGRQRAELGGVRDRLAILAESDAGPWLDPGSPGRRIELLEAIRDGAVVHFALESDRRPLLAQMLGAAIVGDLLAAVAALQDGPCPALVAIDEFSAVAAPEVVRLFARARSAGLSLLLGTQELADLRLAGRERLLEQVVGNLSLLVAHRQVVPASAELVAALAGRRGTWRLTRHSDGRTTRTRTLETRLDADRLTSLARGCAAVVELAGARRARVVRIDARPLGGEVRR